MDRVLQSFDHTTNSIRSAAPTERTVTTLAVFILFKTSGRGTVGEYDKATDMAMLNLQRTVRVFLSAYISHIIHMVHAWQQNVDSLGRSVVSRGGFTRWKHLRRQPNFPPERELGANGRMRAVNEGVDLYLDESWATMK